LEQVIRVGSNKYRIIGIMKEKGSSAFLQMDNVIVTSYNNIRRLYTNPNQSFSLAIQVNDMRNMEPAIGEAEGVFRPIRGLGITEDNNFYVDKSDSIAETFIKLLSTISAAAGAIGFITLLGAAIALIPLFWWAPEAITTRFHGRQVVHRQEQSVSWLEVEEVLVHKASR
jgi:putative ABC transport system permease protein